MKIGRLKLMTAIVAMLFVLTGLSYAFVSRGYYTGNYGSGTVSVSVSDSQTRDFERNVYMKDIVQQSRITYSVVQTKNLKATLDGIYPNVAVVHIGDTVKLKIDSDVNCNFVIDGYRVQARTWPQTTTEIMFNADQLGTYAFQCKGFLGGKI